MGRVVLMIKTSHTQLLSAMRCPWLYFVSRFHRDKMVLQSEAQVVGILVHTVIERFYLECPHKEERGKAKQLAWLMDTMHQEFLKIFGEEVLNAIREHIQAYNDATADTIMFQRDQGKECKAPTWTSYWKRKYGEHFDQLEQDVFLPLAERFPDIRFTGTLLGVYQHIDKSINGFLTLYRRAEKPEKVLIEYRVDPRIDLFGSSKGGRLDLVCFYADGRVKVYDFKSGRKQWTKEKVRNEPQLLGYAYDVFKHFGKLPDATGIWDCFRAEIIEVPYTDADKLMYEFIARGWITYEQGLAKCIEEEGIDETLKRYPLPIGTMEMGCPCNLAYEKNEEIRCPVMRLNAEEPVDDEQ